MELFDSAWQLLGSAGGSLDQWDSYPGSPSTLAQGYGYSTPLTVTGIASGTPLLLRWYTGVNTAASTTVPVPDGGLTVALLGSALLGVAGVRRKLAV